MPNGNDGWDPAVIRLVIAGLLSFGAFILAVIVILGEYSETSQKATWGVVGGMITAWIESAAA
jgi:hypothetical protein